MTSWTPDLSRHDGPRYRAIADAIAAGLHTGQLKPGDRLPTHRDLAYRLADRGLLSVGKDGFLLACDPLVTTAGRVADAVDRDPKLDGHRWTAPVDDVPLAELVELR